MYSSVDIFEDCENLLQPFFDVEDLGAHIISDLFGIFEIFI